MPVARSIGYFVEGILPMCLFAKKPVSAVFTGITNHPTDASVDYLRTVMLPLLRAFGVDTADFVLKVNKRGFLPAGGGEVEFRCPNIRELKCINYCDEGMMRRVRGTAFTAKVSPHVANRVVQSARWPPSRPSLASLFRVLTRCSFHCMLCRSVLDDSLPDVHIYTDHTKGKESGMSPGFAVLLTAETSSGCVIAVERTGLQGVLPEVSLRV